MGDIRFVCCEELEISNSVRFVFLHVPIYPTIPYDVSFQ